MSEKRKNRRKRNRNKYKGKNGGGNEGGGLPLMQINEACWKIFSYARDGNGELLDSLLTQLDQKLFRNYPNFRTMVVNYAEKVQVETHTDDYNEEPYIFLYGYTPLLFAISNFDDNMVYNLLRAGADPTLGGVTNDFDFRLSVPLNPTLTHYDTPFKLAIEKFREAFTPPKLSDWEEDKLDEIHDKKIDECQSEEERMKLNEEYEKTRWPKFELKICEAREKKQKKALKICGLLEIALRYWEYHEESGIWKHREFKNKRTNMEEMKKEMRLKFAGKASLYDGYQLKNSAIFSRANIIKQQGNNQFKEKDLMKAIENYLVAIKLLKTQEHIPDEKLKKSDSKLKINLHKICLSNSAEVFMKLGCFESALHYANMALKLDGKHLKSRVRKVRALLNIGDKEALDIANKELKKLKEDEDAKSISKTVDALEKTTNLKINLKKKNIVFDKKKHSVRITVDTGTGTNRDGYRNGIFTKLKNELDVPVLPLHLLHEELKSILKRTSCLILSEYGLDMRYINENDDDDDDLFGDPECMSPLGKTLRDWVENEGGILIVTCEACPDGNPVADGMFSLLFKKKWKSSEYEDRFMWTFYPSKLILDVLPETHVIKEHDAVSYCLDDVPETEQILRTTDGLVSMAFCRQKRGFLAYLGDKICGEKTVLLLASLCRLAISNAASRREAKNTLTRILGSKYCGNIGDIVMDYVNVDPNEIAHIGIAKEKKNKRYTKEFKAFTSALKSENLPMMSKQKVDELDTKVSDKLLTGWFKGLIGEDQYMWLIDCYRMRIYDERHNPRGMESYHIGCDSLAEAILDFFAFCLCVEEKKAVPRGWDWTEFILRAEDFIPFKFKKSDARNKWGKENIFEALSGGRSLRATAEAIHGYSAFFSEQDTEVEMDSIFAKFKSIAEDLYEEIEDDVFSAEVPKTIIDGISVASLFEKIGGHHAWVQLYRAMEEFYDDEEPWTIT